MMDLYDTDYKAYIPNISAHVIGRKLKTVLIKDQKLSGRIISILKKDKDSFWENLLSGLLENLSENILKYNID
jgi:hypothetical protein